MRLLDRQDAPAATLPCVLRDHPEWHLGRERYWLWSIAVDCPAVLQRLQAARALLGDWLHPPGARQAHVTLFVCGFATATAQLDDDITPARVARLDRARLLAIRPQPGSGLTCNDLDRIEDWLAVDA